MTACALPVVLGFLVPAGVLLRMAIVHFSESVTPAYLGFVFNSLALSGIAACCALAVGVFLAYAQRLHNTPLLRSAARLAVIGYAVPGAVLAVGVIIPFAAFDNWLDGVMREAFGISTGLLLTGSMAALVFAYLVRFLAISLNTVEASLGKVKTTMDDAARSLGRGPLSTLLQVHAPIMWPSLLTAGLVVFVDVMKELPATLVMRPFNFDTLAVQAHNLAADERLAEAALPSLAIVAVGIPPLILLSRAIARARPGSKPAKK